MRKAVVQRDRFTCFCCGFVSAPDAPPKGYEAKGGAVSEVVPINRLCGFMETHPEDHNHLNVDPKTQRLYCVICHAATHIGLADFTNSDEHLGYVQLFPASISQGDVVNITRAYSVCQYLSVPAPIMEGIEETWNVMFEQSYKLTGNRSQIGQPKILATDFSAWLMSADDTLQANFDAKAPDVRFVPEPATFGEAIAFWAEMVRRRGTPETWASQFTLDSFQAKRRSQ